MHFTRTILAFSAAALFWPATGRAQSLERSIERWAEVIAANAERLAARIERKANLIARDIEREFDDDYDRRSSSRDRRDQWDERHGRDLQNQAPRIDTTIAFATDGVVDLSSMRGEIAVTGWDRREARIRATVERGLLDFELSSSRITIEERRGQQNRSRSSETRYEVTIPRGVRVIARTSSGEITITGTGGEVEANTNSGDITIEDVAGRVEVGALSGEITLKQVKGNVDATAVTGSIEATSIEGDLHLESTSGDIIVTDAKGRDVELSTTNGEIAFAGSIDPNGRYEFSSHSGTIDLAIPASTNARFIVGTFSGAIDSDFPITLQPGDRTNRSRRFEFTVGSGGPRIVAESFSGDVEIRKR
jgi:DUF4097 and DUF4098 domain-containing protein YvlB